MPANLTPQYLEAEKRYKQASTPTEKIEAVEEMLAVIPKHKGTEKLQADLKSRLSRLRGDLEKQRKTGGKHDPLCVVEREGAGQVVLAGAVNTGKSSLLKALTHATPDIADYPYTTRAPQPGMMPFENIKIQLVDMPAISQEFWEPRFSGIFRNSDAVLLLADLASPEMLEQVEAVLTILEASKIRFSSSTEEARPGDPVVVKKCLLLGTKADLDQDQESLIILQELYGNRFPVLPVSAVTNGGLEELKSRIYRLLGILRIYSKPPGKKPDLSDPFVLKVGSTVLEAAAQVHRDFAQKLKFARIWGSERFEGQMVHRDHVLADGDIVEFHA